MTPDRWQRVKALFQAALEQPIEQRGAFLAAQTGDDDSLRREVESLLTSDAAGLGFLDRLPVAREALLDDPFLEVPGSMGQAPAQAVLSTGSRVGAYEVVASLGAGGMGEVYKARDTRLDRSVAIKVLPTYVAKDPQTRERFQREARAVAALNHPHICTLHDIGSHDGIDFLVMEYLDGQTLAERLRKGPLPLDQALQCAVQIASALDKAHRAGIVHRDLKPGNIFLVRGAGAAPPTAKLLDFGLAKAMTPASPGSTDLTAPGLIVGTGPYMAPEQVEGKEADARTDLFAFGAVLFEMVSGRKAFQGDSQASVMAAVLEREPPPLSSLQPLSTPAFDRTVQACLAKNPDDRWQTARDLLRELQWLAEPAAGGDTRALARTSGASPRNRTTAAALVSLIALSLAGVLWFGFTRADGPAGDRRVSRFTVDVPKGQVMIGGFNPNLALSSDGAQLAITPFPGPVSVRRLDQVDTHALEVSASPGFRGAPLFSPDGTFLSFIEGNAIFSWTRPFYKAALSGGAATKLADYDAFHKGDWAADGWIYWTAHYPGGIVRIADTGGTIEPVTELDLQHGERSHRFASLLPGEQAVIYTVAFDGINNYDDARIDLWDVKSRKKKTLIVGGTSATYSPSGHIVYARAGKLFAVPFDANQQQVTGAPFEVLNGVLMDTNTGAAQYSLSRRGDLAYVPGPAEGGHRTLVWVDRSGKTERLPLPPASYLYPRLSPDGRYLAVEIEGPNHDVYVYDFARSVLTKITTDGQSHDPVWTPDGKRLAFRSWLAGGMTMWMMPADRSAGAVRLDPTGTRQSPVSFSPDGRFLAFDQKDAHTGDDAWVLTLEGGRQPQPVARTRFGEGSAKFSPDGRWIAYASDESGKAEVYVQPFPGPGPKIQISNAGGFDPVWGRSGGELYYRNENKLMAVALTTSLEIRASSPRQLWEGNYSSGAASSCGMPGVSSSNYDVTPDGQRFLMVRDDDVGFAGTRVVVVLNWAEELKELARTRSSIPTRPSNPN